MERVVLSEPVLSPLSSLHILCVYDSKWFVELGKVEWNSLGVWGQMDLLENSGTEPMVQFVSFPKNFGPNPSQPAGAQEMTS